jgi:glycosyltransferase involved in cell wall biosynthesis
VERIQEYLSLAGKGDRKVAAVFSPDAADASRAIAHLQRGAPGIPVWLFTASTAPAEAAAACETVFVEPDSMALAVCAQQELWPCRVALSVAVWTGARGRWPVKLAPFFVPPFRVLAMNEHGDFFAATPAAVARHAARRARDAMHSAWNRVKDLHRGAWLWWFALVAQWFSPVSRYAFRRWHGAQPLESLAAAASEGEGIETFAYAERSWDTARLRAIVEGSSARWILFLGNHEEIEVAAWLPLFNDPCTFAVGAQTRAQGWHPGLFPVAPFRAMQAGEVSQTLAPVSPVMLVERAKLRALGVPQTVTPGGAWYLWFWQAAAAGWRSYSAGAGAAVEEVTEWPYEEAEFVTRVLADERLRRLGPREAALARGSIAFSLPPRVIRGSKPRVLIVSPYLPYPLSHGGAVRIYNLCRALAPRVDFLLASFRERSDTVHYDGLHDLFAEVYAVDFDERASRDGTIPKQVREHVSVSMAALIEELRRTRRIDVVQVEYTHMARFRGSAGDRAILVEHDLTFSLYRQLGNHEDTQQWLDLERRAFREYAGIWTMSEEDRACAIAEGARAEDTFVVPNGVDLARYQPCETPSEAPEILYVGSFRHRPNVLGYKKLRYEIMPRVWQHVPNAVLRVVAGPEPEKYWREPAPDKRVALHGFVEDLRPFYARAAVVAVPLVVSAGTNIKVMEAMACRKAVVTTPIGCAGLGLLDGYDAWIREDAAEFAGAMAGLLEDEELRRSTGANARRTVEQRFAWEAIADAAYASYERLW